MNLSRLKGYALLLGAIAPISPLFSAGPQTPEQTFECLKEKASTAVDRGEAGEFLNKAFEFMDKTKMWKPLMAIEAQRLDLVQQLVGDIAAPGKPIHSVQVGANGERNQLFLLVQQMSKNWKDKEKVSEIVKAICQGYHPRVAEFCIDSFWQKQENVEAFLKIHEAKINEIAADMPKSPQTYQDKIGGYEFTRDDITDSNLRFGFSTTIGTENVHSRIASFMGQTIQIPVFVTNSQNQPVGALMTVITNGTPRYYFAERVPSSPTSPKFVNPFFFVFGSDSSENWNSHFEGMHGGLFVDGKPLQEWIRSNS